MSWPRATRGFGDDADVLVELEPHVLGVSGRISCLASQSCTYWYD